MGVDGGWGIGAGACGGCGVGATVAVGTGVSVEIDRRCDSEAGVSVAWLVGVAVEVLAVLFDEWSWVSPQYPRCKQVDIEEEFSAGIVQFGNYGGSTFKCPAYGSVALDTPHRHRRYAAQDQQQQQAG